jgi:hypothetical protein
MPTLSSTDDEGEPILVTLSGSATGLVSVQLDYSPTGV